MRYYTPLATLALALTLAACSQDAIDEPTPEAPGNVHITLSAPFTASEHRAPTSAYTAEVAPTRELIESYYVIFTQATATPNVEKIVRVAREDDVTTGGEGVTERRLDLELRPGTYKVYAFVNMPFVDGSDADSDADELVLGPNTTLDLGEGESFNTSDLASASYLLTDDILTSAAVGAGKHVDGQSFFLVDDIAKIPMTSVCNQEITVTERNSQTFGIEVVRMLGKVQFDFRNPTATNLQINGIKMSDLTVNNSSAVAPKRDGATKLMNYIGRYADHDAFLAKDIELPTGASTASLNYTVSPLSPLLLNAKTTTDDGTATASFYVLESKAREAVGKSFDLDFDITPTTGGPYTDNVRYAITKPDIFTTIHRNDWIVIPVAIGEWVMSLTAFSYPPIGGYPEARVDADNTGNFHVAFSTPGDVSFYPVIHKFYSTTDYYYLNDPVHIVSYTLTPSDPSGIFTATPTVDPSTGEILATLSGTSGKATITLTVNFKKTSTSPTETLTSKIEVEFI